MCLTAPELKPSPQESKAFDRRTSHSSSLRKSVAKLLKHISEPGASSILYHAYAKCALLNAIGVGDNLPRAVISIHVMLHRAKPKTKRSHSRSIHSLHGTPMNFSNHKHALAQSIEQACAKPKVLLLSDFSSILERAKKLFQTNEFDFWLRALNTTDTNEIATTIYGHQNALHWVRSLNTQDRNTFVHRLGSICECLFTYSTDDECCPMQSDFHYYYNLSTQSVFKLSELGAVEGDYAEERRVAYLCR